MLMAEEVEKAKNTICDYWKSKAGLSKGILSIYFYYHNFHGSTKWTVRIQESLLEFNSKKDALT